MPEKLRDAFGWKVGDEVAFLREKDGVKIVRAEKRRRGRAIVERLKRASWNRRLSTDRLMVLTRGSESQGRSAWRLV